MLGGGCGQWHSKLLEGPCAEIWWWALELVFGLKQNKMGAFKIILCAYIALQLRYPKRRILKFKKLNYLLACLFLLENILKI